MKIAILQSGYMPWLGFFDLLNQADIFVFYDDVQWSTGSWRNRNRIRSDQGWSWITVPIRFDGPHLNLAIKDVKINYERKWQKKHLGSLWACYKKSPYFEEIYPLFESVLSTKYQFVIELNYEIIFAICKYMSLEDKRFLFSQDMHIDKGAQKTERLLNVFEEIGGVTTYISGPAAMSYLEEDKVSRMGIKVEWHNYQHPYYNQNTWGSNMFISYLSVADLLFNHGKDSMEILSGAKVIEKPENVQLVTPDEYNQKVKND